MPSGPFAHVCLLVHDLDRAIDDWTKILRVLDPGQLEERIVRYEDFEGGEDRMAWATFVSSGGTEIQFMAPGPETPLGRRLAKHGEGVHHLCFTTDDPEGAAARLAAEGIETGGEVFEDPRMPWQRWTWVLPGSAHGTLVEVARPYEAVDGTWESASGS
jgi:methylmalonyl-CoA/ethylmalonyl-CoA epimerase